MKVTRHGTICLLIAFAGFLLATSVVFFCFRGSDDVSLSSTPNLEISVSSGVVTCSPPVSVHSLGSKDIEAAEGINAEMMRRSRESLELTSPLRAPGK